MRRVVRVVIFLFVASVLSFAEISDRIHISLDGSEAEAALAILEKHSANQPIIEADWQSLFSTRPYQRLKKREASFKRAFTDDQFREFLLKGEPSGNAAELRRTLDSWKKADLKKLAAQMLEYLPSTATIHATVYPVIKPMHNSFVWDLQSDAAIFFYLNPEVTGAKFENTAAHELHHVGLQSISKEQDSAIAGLPENVRSAANWMGAFGEGFAMLAAAGSPDVDPHKTSNAAELERWNRDVANFDSDLREVDSFFRDLIAGKLTEKDARERGMTFFGTQGPWYTVGYKMAAAVERQFGRKALLDCMRDPRCLLATWNLIAGSNAKWSNEVLGGVNATPVGR